MNDLGLAKSIESYRADYVRVTGKVCEHFHCPILRRDDKAELIRGHIVNGALETNNSWVPQRKDIDGFYGSVVEADLISIVQDRCKDPFEIWFDPTLRKKHRPKVVCGNETWGYYFTDGSPPPVAGHTPLIITDSKDRTICNLSLKVSPERLIEAKDDQIELVVEKDYRPSVIAAMLKAAHLTLFKMMGYEHVVSAAGLLLADILKVFFLKHEGSHGVSEAGIEQHFLPFENMLAPLFVENENWFRGTIEDNMFLTLLTSSDQIFALGVIVRAGSDRFCVFLPTDCGKTINTYFSFLNVPPTSVRAKATRFRPPNYGDTGAWEADVNDLRIPLNKALPEKKAGRALLVHPD